jgi:hypothetical protein
MDLNEIGWKSMEWINLDWGKDKLRFVVKSAMTFFSIKIQIVSGLAVEILASQEGHCCVQLVSQLVG